MPRLPQYDRVLFTKFLQRFGQCRFLRERRNGVGKRLDGLLVLARSEPRLCVRKGRFRRFVTRLARYRGQLLP